MSTYSVSVQTFVGDDYLKRDFLVKAKSKEEALKKFRHYARINAKLNYLGASFDRFDDIEKLSLKDVKELKVI
jgi:hypothetical protein